MTTGAGPRWYRFTWRLFGVRAARWIASLVFAWQRWLSTITEKRGIPNIPGNLA